jgi:mRNA interferase MazF
MKQGDVYWYDFRAPDKRRPVLILTRNSAISYLTNVTVAQITTTIRGVPSEVTLTPGDDGAFEPCVINAYNIQTVPKEKLRELITGCHLNECERYATRLSSLWDSMHWRNLVVPRKSIDGAKIKSLLDKER